MDCIIPYLERYGRPVALYTDKPELQHKHAQKATRGKDLEKEATGVTQIGRALAECGIEHIIAQRLQAKGRIERTFGTYKTG
jgi:hypothetical protein